MTVAKEEVTANYVPAAAVIRRLWKEDVRELGIDPDKLIEGYSAAVDEWFAANG